MLPHKTLEVLRQFWTTHRHPPLLFPNPRGGAQRMQEASAPMNRGGNLDFHPHVHFIPRLFERLFYKKLQRPPIRCPACGGVMQIITTRCLPFLKAQPT